MAGAESDQALTRTELERIILEAGFEPVERNCFFQRMEAGCGGLRSAAAS